MAQLLLSKNAHLDAWKQAFLQAALDASEAATSAIAGCLPAIRPVQVAQCLLESAWGTHHLGDAHNYFGIKGHGVSARTQEVFGGQVVTLTDGFAAFPDMATCFRAHAALLMTHPAYAEARTHGTDPVAFGHALTGKYATDPEYGQKLEAIMQSRGLLESFGFAA